MKGHRWLALLSLLVPTKVRRAWRQEWEAELAAAPPERRRDLLRGAVADAFATRRWAARLHARRNDSREGGSMGMGGWIRETKRAARSLARTPGFTAAAVVTLGVGLGATAAIFTLVDALLLRPLPYPGGDRLVSIHQTMTGQGLEGREWPLTRHTWLFFAEENRAFEAMGAHFQPGTVTLTPAGGESASGPPAERVRWVSTTAGLLDMLGARAALGRLYTGEDDRPDAERVAVLSHGLWQGRYGGDPGVLGRSLVLNGTPWQIIGVMREGVALPEEKVDVWTPARIDPAGRVTDEFRLAVLGRLPEGGTVEGARADLDRLTARMPELAPFFRAFLDDLGLRTRVRLLRDEVVGDVARPLWILLGAVGLVLLVAAANTANLFLVRTEGRRREVGIRTALGAGRGDLAALFLAESAAVATLAAALGLGLAMAGVRALVALAPPSIPRLDELQVTAPTLAVLALLAVAAAAVLGLYPWTRFGRGAAHGPGLAAARGAGRGAAAGEDRRSAATGGLLVVGQVALALVLLSASALLLRSFQQLRAVDPGFDAEGVLVATLALPAGGYESEEAVADFLGRLESRLEGLPAVRGVASGPVPVRAPGESELCSVLYVEGMVLEEGRLPPCTPSMAVDADYLPLLGIRLVEGRGPTAAEVADRAPVAVVSRNLADRLWPGESALGQGVRPGPRRGPPFYRVIGVADPVRSAGLDRDPGEMLYLPSFLAFDDRGSFRSPTLLVRTTPGAPTDPVAEALRTLAGEIDPNVPVTVQGTLSEAVGRTMVRTSFTMFLLGTAAATALVLGLVGLYGVVAYRVGTRRAEIGVRMALGARTGQVRAMVLGHSLRLVAAGVVVGVGGALLTNRLLEGLLFGVRPGDPWMLAGAATALVVTATAASWIPAARATRVDPARTLRRE